MDKDSMVFVVYLIHACADHWHMTPKQVYHKLKEANCITGYLVPHYEILHTQGTDYLVDDIKTYLDVRGVSV